MIGIINFIRLKFHFKFYNNHQIKRYQLKQINKLICYARKHSPYYKLNLPEGKIKNLKDYQEIPIINKQTLMNNLETTNTINASYQELNDYAINNELQKQYLGYFRDRYVVGLSSGTSGNRGIYITDKKLTKQLPFIFLSRSGIPLRLLPFNILFCLRVFSQGFEDINSPFIKLTYLSTMEKVDHVISEINRLNINVLLAPPSFIRLLLPYHHRITASLKLIMTYAEVLPKIEKDKFKNIFQAQVIEIYQASEGQIASTCHAGNLHLNEDLVYVELYDEEGNLVEDENKVATRMIVTNLVNYAQPLIRYEMNDLIRLKSTCSCGSKFRVVDEIIGRKDDILYFYDSNYQLIHLFPDLFVRWIISESDDINEFIVINHQVGHLEILLDVKEECDQANLKQSLETRIMNELSEFKVLDYNLMINFQAISLPKDKNKFKRFIRNYQINKNNEIKEESKNDKLS